MSKPNKNKIYLSSFLLIFCMLLFTALYGCGTGPDTAAAPGPTPTPTVYNVALTADLATLQAGQNSILTATVTAGDGKVASGQMVVFAFMANPSGATLTPVGTGITDASGRALAIYTAGSTGTASVQDTIQAVDTGFTSATGAVIITRTASTVTPPVGYRMTLTADVTSLAAGKNAIVTATVTDSSGNPASGQTVTFAFNPTPAPSGGSLTTLISGVTDASGRAVAIYKAGATNPTTSVQDTIQASVTGYTSGAIVMTQTASTATPPVGYRLTVTATPVSLAANAMSVIVAKVINNADGSDASGVAVTFAKLIDNSGATLTTVGSGITDASGTAIATYTAGNNTPSLSIQDVVTASVTGSAGAAIITRLPTLGTGNRIISFTEIPETLPGTPVSGVVIMKVKVTTDNLTSPVVGVTVTFTILAGGTGTLSSSTATTDTNGEAYVIFTRPATGSGETVVRAQIPGTINGGDAARIVYWSQSAATSLTIAVVPTPDTVYAGQQSIVVATVLNSDATPAAGQTVSFQFANGVATGPSGATISTINSGLTNASGEAWAAYTAGNLTPALDIIDIVQATVSGTVGLATITRSKSDVSSGGYSITSFGGIPATLPATGSRFSDTGAANCELKAKVEGNFLGGPAVGIPVTFSIFRGPGTLPTVTIVSTDTNGEAWILFDLPVPGAGAETVVRATVPLVAPQTNGGDTVSVIYW